MNVNLQHIPQVVYTFQFFALIARRVFHFHSPIFERYHEIKDKNSLHTFIIRAQINEKGKQNLCRRTFRKNLDEHILYKYLF